MTTLQTLTTANAGMKRECDCPTWVLRCVHWEGEALWLIDEALPSQCPWVEDYDSFSVNGPGLLEPCACGCPETNFIAGHDAQFQEFGLDRAAAEREFHRREAQLCRRGS